jgi:hypothetical protein
LLHFYYALSHQVSDQNYQVNLGNARYVSRVKLQKSSPPCPFSHPLLSKASTRM